MNENNFQRLHLAYETLTTLSALIRRFGTTGVLDQSCTGWQLQKSGREHIQFKVIGDEAGIAWAQITPESDGKYLVDWGHSVGYGQLGHDDLPRPRSFTGSKRSAQAFALNQLYASVHGALVRAKKLVSTTGH